MSRIKLSIVAACMAVAALGGTAAPASASDCSMGGGDTDLSGVCQIIVKFVCRGNPCLD